MFYDSNGNIINKRETEFTLKENAKDSYTLESIKKVK